MSETVKKPTLARKAFITIALLLILVGFPLGSWLYLRQGVNWRRAAVGELSAYGQIRSANVIFPDGTKEDRLKKKVVVLHMFEEEPDLTDTNRKVIETGQRLFDQFGQNEYFRIAMITQGGTAEFRSYIQKMPSYDYATWVWTSGLGSWSTILNNGFEAYYVKNKISSYPQYFALTDTSGVIRRYYNALDEKEVGRMVEQISILLPQK